MAKPQTPADGAEKAARIATVETDINSRATLLLGTFGTEATRRALVRLPDGDVRKVAPGDTLDGGKVVAVSDGSLLLSQAGMTRTLRLP
jgi:hypothetical protein